ncbi:AraC family transcriptional regulator [Parachryseolinea silvisoli]|uniref:AraC family transcriptional regulator n=1 Tax=Parachryseolinea silvisoli TaxID=2873601 RepID=UPI002265F369|nr:AraC family transcriptional regulator [Parachryseolinea silvisoli]MCD9017098.1 AraC family transcriptional regulator [Parachryseolinea silvisoli]
MKKIPVRAIGSPGSASKATADFRIRDLRAITLGKERVEDFHRHDFYYILVLEKGKGNHEIDFESYPVTHHVVFLVAPGQVHRLTLGAGSTGHLLQFQAAFVQRNSSRALLRRAGYTTFHPLDAAGFKKISFSLQQMLEEYTTKQEGYEDVIQAHFDIFFVELARHREASGDQHTYAHTHERLASLQDLLRQHIGKYKQVTKYADLLHVSPYQLNALTRTFLNKTASEVIQDFVVLEAKRCLLGTTHQVKEIAFQLGYEDVSYFIRFFKKQTGHTPESFRQSFK